MEKVVGEFKAYLNSILAEHTTISAGDTIADTADKLKQLTDFTEDYNSRAIDKALEILGDPDVVANKAMLKDELATIIREYSEKFLRENFKST